MRFDLHGRFILSADATGAAGDVKAYLDEANSTLLKKGAPDEDGAKVVTWRIEGATLFVEIESFGRVRAHDAMLRLRKGLAERLGKKLRIGVRDVKIDQYEVSFEVERAPKHAFTMPLVRAVKVDDRVVTLELEDVTEEFIANNYIDRMMRLAREKVQHQYYEGKGEMHNVLYASPPREPAWNRDPSEVMLERDWLKQGPTKGKWFFRPQAAAILRAMERIAVGEVLAPLGFEEVILPHHVSLENWVKTGHAHGVPNEIYYVVEPRTRDMKEWERYADLLKITRKVPTEELMKNLSPPVAGVCYAQCENVYWSLSGKTVADASLPIRVFDRTAVSNRYESGGRHGIERVDEFHRIEPVYVGTKEQLLDERRRLLDRYQHVFNDILELEWRVASVTPFYMSHSGLGDIASAEGGEAREKTLADAPDTGTLDFEAWLPYRGSREESEWLEFQNLSIVGDKYTEAFNIKGQRAELWSGCSGIGLERWSVAFLSQKGLDPAGWPEAFRRYLPEVPKGAQFL